MRPSLWRRVSCMERVLAARRCDHYLWQDEDETDEALQARIRARIESGAARPNDRFITFRWRSPAAATAAEK
jgi:hypothetical protein